MNKKVMTKEIIDIPVVHVTDNYEQFKRIIGNRPVKMNHVNGLIKSINKNNLLSVFPMVVTRDMYIIDGQHRLEAAKANKWSIYYIQAQRELDDIIVALVNTNHVSWKPYNFLHFFAERGNEQYLFIEECLEKYKISLSNFIGLIKPGGHELRSLKKGEYFVYSTEEDKQVITDLIEAYLLTKDMFTLDVFLDREYTQAFRILMSQISLPQLKEAINKSSLQITAQKSVKDYLRLFEIIINRYRHEKNHVRFF